MCPISAMRGCSDGTVTSTPCEPDMPHASVFALKNKDNSDRFESVR